jgi:hypothetical protein
VASYLDSVKKQHTVCGDVCVATVCVSVCGTMEDIDGNDLDTIVEREVNEGYMPICGEMGCSFVSGSVTRFGRVKKARNAI